MPSLSVALQKQTFTLRRMMKVVAVVAVVVAFIQAYPVLAAQLVVNLLLAAPALIVLSVATWLSPNPRQSLIVIGLAIFAGWLISPYIYVSWSRPPTFWDRFKVDFNSIGLFMIGGAFVGVVMDMIIRFAMLKKNRKNAE